MFLHVSLVLEGEVTSRSVAVEVGGVLGAERAVVGAAVLLTAESTEENI